MPLISTDIAQGPFHRRDAVASPPVWHSMMGRWLNRLRERDAMARLTLRDMRDAGITPYDVGAECAKPFWKA